MIDEGYEVDEYLLVDLFAEKELDFSMLVFVFFSLLCVFSTEEFYLGDIFELVFGDIIEPYGADMVPCLYDLDLVFFFDNWLVSSKDDIHISNRLPNDDVRFFDVSLVWYQDTFFILIRLPEIIHSEDECGKIFAWLIEQQSDLSPLSLTRLVCVNYVGFDLLLLFMEIVDKDMVLPFFKLDCHAQRTICRELIWLNRWLLCPNFLRGHCILDVLVRVVFVNDTLKVALAQRVLSCLMTDTPLLDIGEPLLKRILNQALQFIDSRISIWRHQHVDRVVLNLAILAVVILHVNDGDLW